MTERMPVAFLNDEATFLCEQVFSFLITYGRTGMKTGDINREAEHVLCFFSIF